jgi:ribosome-associated protein
MATAELGVGGDLRMPAAAGLPHGATIPASELTERFSKSSGPGGQSVNTTDSRVELLFEPGSSPAFTDPQRHRILRHLDGGLVDGKVVVVASEHRSQHRNRTAARTRLVALLRAAVAPPPPARRPTRPSRASQRRRVEGKKARGRTKSLRGQVDERDR